MKKDTVEDREERKDRSIVLQSVRAGVTGNEWNSSLVLDERREDPRITHCQFIDINYEARIFLTSYFIY